MRVRDATTADLAAVAALHVAALPHDFLSQLGASFLRQVYPTFLQSELGFLLVAEEEGRVVGFVSCACDTARFFRTTLRRRWPCLMLLALRRLLFHPRDLARLLGAWRYPTKNRALTMPELVSIAVEPRWQGRGVGRRLLNEFDQRLKQRRARRFFLTVGTDNRSARGFYAKLGFVEEGEIHAMRRHFVRLVKEVV
jgi:ribosomal protein S18 acetylase RimI-like enzyme